MGSQPKGKEVNIPLPMLVDVSGNAFTHWYAIDRPGKSCLFLLTTLSPRNCIVQRTGLEAERALPFLW